MDYRFVLTDPGGVVTFLDDNKSERAESTWRHMCNWNSFVGHHKVEVYASRDGEHYRLIATLSIFEEMWGT